MVNELAPFGYLGNSFSSVGLARPALSNLPTWLKNIHRAPLKPDQKLTAIRDHIIPRLVHATQNLKITSKALKDADRLVRLWVKRMLHHNIHTPDASIYAKLKDGGLGILELKTNIPNILLKRLTKIRENDADPTGQSVHRLQRMVGDVPAEQLWRDKIKSGAITSGLEQTADSAASRSWLQNKPKGWTGRDFVRAVQLRSGNLPTAAIPSNPPDKHQCRAGCTKQETICHVLQGCPATHWPRIKRHNEIAQKINNHCKIKRLQTEYEPHIRHQDGTLSFKLPIIMNID